MAEPNKNSPETAQAEITQLAVEVFEDADYATAWLNERNVALDNRTPAEVVMSNQKGAEVVKNLLLRIQYCVLA